jgi:sulfotransferase
MQNGIHFISGLPRSGSTLLAGILKQNPRFSAEMSSPVGAMFSALQRSMSGRNEGAVFINDDQKREVLRGLFNSFYHAIHPKQLVFDTNRVWCAKLPTLVQLYPEAKVICCVRQLGWIIDSIERLIRSNAFDVSGIFGFEPNLTVYTRAARVASSDGLVGFALDALREAYFGEEADRLILIDYEALTRQPKDAIAEIYKFIGEAPFAHDFDNVEYSANEFDIRLGTPNLHTVKRKVEWTERRSILPPELFARFGNDAFWTNPQLNTRKVKVVLPRR